MDNFCERIGIVYHLTVALMGHFSYLDAVWLGICQKYIGSGWNYYHGTGKQSQNGTNCSRSTVRAVCRAGKKKVCTGRKQL